MRQLHSRRNVAGAAGAAVLIGLIAWGYHVMIGMPAAIEGAASAAGQA